jgi:hypothetical protein
MNQAQEFKQQIYKNLQNNGFPEKRIGLPLEKLYEQAEIKGVNLNDVLDQMNDEGIGHEKTDDQIIFTLVQIAEEKKQEMFKQANDMLANMSEAEKKQINEMLGAMTEDQKREMIEQAKKMGLM